MQMNKKIKKTTRVVDVPKNNEWPVTIRFNHARLLFRWINLFSTFIALLFNTGLEWMETKFCGFASMNFIVYFTHSQTQKKIQKKEIKMTRSQPWIDLLGWWKSGPRNKHQILKWALSNLSRKPFFSSDHLTFWFNGKSIPKKWDIIT